MAKRESIVFIKDLEHGEKDDTFFDIVSFSFRWLCFFAYVGLNCFGLSVGLNSFSAKKNVDYALLAMGLNILLNSKDSSLSLVCNFL